MIIHFLDFIGLTATNKMYNFWSGFGSDLSELAIVGALFKGINCHEKGCWRLGAHYKGHIVCHKHREAVDNAL